MSAKWRLGLCLGLLAVFAVGVVWSWNPSNPAVQVSTDQPATTSTTPSASTTPTPTTIVMIDGEPFPIPVPPLPPGVTQGPGPAGGVTNIHVPVTALDPAAQAAVDDMLRALTGSTTTTTR